MKPYLKIDHVGITFTRAGAMSEQDRGSLERLSVCPFVLPFVSDYFNVIMRVGRPLGVGARFRRAR